MKHLKPFNENQSNVALKTMTESNVKEDSDILAQEIESTLSDLVEKYNAYFNKYGSDFSKEGIEGDTKVLDAWVNTLSKSPSNGGKIYWHWDKVGNWRA